MQSGCARPPGPPGDDRSDESRGRSSTSETPPRSASVARSASTTPPDLPPSDCCAVSNVRRVVALFAVCFFLPGRKKSDESLLHSAGASESSRTRKPDPLPSWRLRCVATTDPDRAGCAALPAVCATVAPAVCAAWPSLWLADHRSATALTAAETGHLVLSTLHTNDAIQA